MSKIYGLFGSMTGKLADVVMVVRNGEQIARKYQPIVANPNSKAQIANRARLKLLSQLSAVAAPVIAIPRRGSVSSRNLFTRRNYGLSSYNDASNAAEINLASLQLTDSVLPMGIVSNYQRLEDHAEVVLAQNTAPGDINRVVWIVFRKTANNQLQFFGSSVSNTPGAGRTFNTALPLTPDPVVVYAYGVRDNTDAARVTFGNLTTLSAESVAKILVSRVLTDADVSVTMTSGKEFSAATQALQGNNETRKK